jgi:hypothetical protein
MNLEDFQKLAEKVKNGTATEEEKLVFLQEANKAVKGFTTTISKIKDNSKIRKIKENIS